MAIYRGTLADQSPAYIAAHEARVAREQAQVEGECDEREAA